MNRGRTCLLIIPALDERRPNLFAVNSGSRSSSCPYSLIWMILPFFYLKNYCRETKIHNFHHRRQRLKCTVVNQAYNFLKRGLLELRFQTLSYKATVQHLVILTQPFLKLDFKSSFVIPCLFVFIADKFSFNSMALTL